MANIPVTLAIKTLLDADNLAQSKAALIAIGAAVWNFVGAYSGGASYAVGDVVTYQGQTWYRLDANGGNVGDTPAEGTFWTILAQAGAGGGGAGTPLTGDVTTSGSVATIATGAVTVNKIGALAVTNAKLAVNAAQDNITLLPVAKGGTGTASPAIVAGTNVTVSGAWPNQTINAAVKQGFAKNITAGNANSAEVYQTPLARFTLPASVSADGKIMLFTGDVYVQNSFSVQPDSGVYLFLRRHGETDHAKQFLITLPTASTPYKLSVSLGVLFNADSTVQEAFGRQSMIRTSISQDDGTTCVSVSDGNIGSTLFVPESANDLITIGQLVDIQFGILTINSSGVVNGSYSLNGFMEVSHF